MGYGDTNADTGSAGLSRQWLIAGLILLASAAVFFILFKLKPEPQEKPREERIRSVSCIEAKRGTLRIELTAYGTARSIRELRLASEVSGRIKYCRPDLKDGVLTDQGELLIEIEPVDYEIALRQAEAEIAQLDLAAAQIKSQHKIDGSRLQILENDLSLAEKNYQRIKRLAARDASSEALSEQAEQAVMQKRNSLLTLQNMVELYPIQLEDLAAKKQNAVAKAELAEIQLKRCRIVSPFAGRVEELSVESGQYVSAGQFLLSLADDRQLEVPVSVDAADAMMLGLGNRDDAAVSSPHWFGDITGITAELGWTDAPVNYRWPAEIVRVEKFDPETRTIMLVLRPYIRDDEVPPYPLVAGMFCQAYLRGVEVKDVIRVPRAAMQFAGKIYVLEESRIGTREVSILHRAEDCLVIDHGIDEGDIVIAERLPFGVVEGTLIKPTMLSPHCPETTDTDEQL